MQQLPVLQVDYHGQKAEEHGGTAHAEGYPVEPQVSGPGAVSHNVAEQGRDGREDDVGEGSDEAEDGADGLSGQGERQHHPDEGVVEPVVEA